MGAIDIQTTTLILGLNPLFWFLLCTSCCGSPFLGVFGSDGQGILELSVGKNSGPWQNNQAGFSLRGVLPRLSPQQPIRITGIFLSTSSQRSDYVYESKVFPQLSQFFFFFSKSKHLSRDENEGQQNYPLRCLFFNSCPIKRNLNRFFKHVPF